MATHTLGIDIGGANLKAAHSNGTARTVPFALWKHPDQLGNELRKLCATMPTHERVAVTMTGELCDCFPSKVEGVRAILESVQGAFEESRVRVWSTEGRFVRVRQALEEPLCAAAANWLAQAHFVATRYPAETVLLLDTGSTTTDIVYLERGTPKVIGRTDAARLISGELVYTGLRRTPICAVLGMEVAAEFFATMLDAYLCIGRVGENAADRDTADGRPATHAFAHARLARMRCTDAALFSEDQARSLAQRALDVQWNAIEQAVERVLAGRPALQRIVVSGSGEIVGRCVCERHPEWCKIEITSLAETLSPMVSEAACAYAVAVLASEG